MQQTPLCCNDSLTEAAPGAFPPPEGRILIPDTATDADRTIRRGAMSRDIA